MGPVRYAEYTPPFWPWQWVRWWLARRRNHRPLNDGIDYVGWATRVVGDHDPMGLPPPGSTGLVTGSEIQCGELTHCIDFDGWQVWAPLPMSGIELIPPRPPDPNKHER
jgi:hypothetical protein